MHQLTHNDIRNYAQSRLCEHPRWNALVEETSASSSQSLINDTLFKSNGVFLWVFLVTRLLREGLSNDDSIADLRARLSSFPTDLKDFFRHILESVDSFYHEKTARTLMITLEAEEPLYLEIYLYHDYDFEDESFPFKEPTEAISTDLEKLAKAFSSVSRRINGRCKGLLERSGDKMDFLQRTVYDHLRTAEMTEFLKERVRTSFSPSAAILRAWVAWIKRSNFPKGSVNITKRNLLKENPSFVERMRQCLIRACLTDTESEASSAVTTSLLDNMEVGLRQMIRRG